MTYVQKSRQNGNRVLELNENEIVKDIEFLIGKVNDFDDGSMESENLTLTGTLEVGGESTFSSPISLPDGADDDLSIKIGEAGNHGFYSESGTEMGVVVGGFEVSKFTTLGVSTDIIAEFTADEGVTVDGALIKDSTIALSDGAVGNLSVKIGADKNNGIYGTSDTQLGIAIEGALVAGANTTGLFTGNIAEQVADAGVTVDGVLHKDSTITLADGTVSNLSIKIGADANNGIFGLSDGMLGFVTEGTMFAGIDGQGLFVNNIAEMTSDTGVTVDGLLVKDGGIKPSGTTATGGVTYSGTISTTGAGTPRTLNALVGTVEFTGVADIVAGAAGTVVINNSLVTASSIGMVSLQTTTAAAGSIPRVESVTYGVGTITIVLRNSSVLTATDASTYKFSFQLFKL